MRKNKRYLSRDLKLQLRLSQGLLRKMGVIIAAELKADVKIVQAGLRMVINGHQIGRYVRDNINMPRELMCSIADVEDIGKGNKFVQASLNRFIWGGLAKEKPDVVVVSGKRLVLFGYEIIYGTVEGKTLIIHRNGMAYNPLTWWFHKLQRSVHKSRNEQMVMMVDSVLEIARYYDNTPGKWHYSKPYENVVKIRDQDGKEWLVKNMVPTGVGGFYAGDINDTSVSEMYPHKVKPLNLGGLPIRADIKIDWNDILGRKDEPKLTLSDKYDLTWPVDYFRQDLKHGGYKLDAEMSGSFSVRSFSARLPDPDQLLWTYNPHFGPETEAQKKWKTVPAASYFASAEWAARMHDEFYKDVGVHPDGSVRGEIGLITGPDAEGYVRVKCGGFGPTHEWPPEWMGDPKLGKFFKPNGQIDLIAVANNAPTTIRQRHRDLLLQKPDAEQPKPEIDPNWIGQYSHPKPENEE